MHRGRAHSQSPSFSAGTDWSCAIRPCRWTLKPKEPRFGPSRRSAYGCAGSRAPHGGTAADTCFPCTARTVGSGVLGPSDMVMGCQMSPSCQVAKRQHFRLELSRGLRSGAVRSRQGDNEEKAPPISRPFSKGRTHSELVACLLLRFTVMLSLRSLSGTAHNLPAMAPLTSDINPRANC